MEETKIEYATEDDFRAWDPFGGAGGSIHTKRKAEQREPRPKPERKPKLEKAEKPERKVSTKKAVENVVKYKKSYNHASATVKALGIVTGYYFYNLSDSSTPEARKERRAGWLTFCRLVQLLHPGYTVRGISDALTVPNAPCRELLSCMFDCAKECGRTDFELKQRI